jgi:glutamate dehydrogenase
VAGVGDMSGDVFGNGMLLSQQIKLVAAFDHRDIFLDPDPDPETSYNERLRMFNLARSSWNDYDKAKISQGGGVFSRSLKSIPISAEIATKLGIEAGALSPFELMQAILKAPVELLYFGGIGTYIKAGYQTHVDVGDKANDAVRIDAADVRAKVIGEGANLGLTQVGRIELAERGVALNSDAIDNSAGVDCSDHEVNIKILLGALIAKGALKAEDRDALLAKMTDEVSELVLKDNYNQTLALSLAQNAASDDNLATQAFLSDLEARGRLDRKVEDLPKNTLMEQRRKAGNGLYRPELAVVMAYAKIVLFDDIMASKAPDDAGFVPLLVDYFPRALAPYHDAILAHRLHREIIATVLCNDIVNMAGPSFIKRLCDSADVDIAVAVKAFETVRQLFGINDLWQQVSGLDNHVPTPIQTRLYEKIVAFVRHQTYWMARRFAATDPVLEAMITPFKDGAALLMAQNGASLTESQKDKLNHRTAALMAKGAPQSLAAKIALLAYLHQSADIIELAHTYAKDVAKTAELYFLCGQKFGFDLLCEGAGTLSSHDPWDRMATRRLIEDVRNEQKTVVKMMMQTMTLAESPEEIVAHWQADHRERLEPLNRLLQTFGESVGDSGASLSFAKLTIVNARLREWVSRL